MIRRESPPVEKPRARIVCDEPDRHIVIVRLSANRYCVPPHGVYEVVGAATRYTNNIEHMLGSCVRYEADAIACRNNLRREDGGDAYNVGVMLVYGAATPCWNPLTDFPGAPPGDRSVAGILISIVLLGGNS